MSDIPLGEILEPFGTLESSGIIHPEPLRESKWLYALCHDQLGMNDETYQVGLKPGTHMEYCAELEDSVGDCQFRGTSQTLVHYEMPRGTYKTSIACEGLVLGAITKNPNIRILLVNADHESAKKRIKGIKWHFSANEEFQNVYGDDWKPAFQTAAWSSTQLTVSKRTKGNLREPTVDTASVGKDMTGSHYDLIIADDLVNRENIKTPEKRTEVYEYLMSCLALLDPGGTLMVIGTRWHPDDAYGRMIKQDEKLARNGKSPNFRYYIKSCWDGPTGNFFPEKFTEQFLAEQKQRTGSHFFAANYENKPVADEDVLFNMDLARQLNFTYLWNGTCGFVDHAGEKYPVENTIAWDPAGRSPSRNSDFHGITIVGTDPFDRWWIHEAEGYKALPSAVVDRMCNYIAYYRPWTIIVESVGGYGLWIDLLQAEMIRRGLKCGILEDKVGGQSKATRIAMIEPRWNNMAMFMKPNQTVLYEQIAEFAPGSTMIHEDVLDSLSKHHGNTIQAQDLAYKLENPYDPEWEAYVRESQSNAPVRTRAGRGSNNWAV